VSWAKSARAQPSLNGKAPDAERHRQSQQGNDRSHDGYDKGIPRPLSYVRVAATRLLVLSELYDRHFSVCP
jgi:hypothetical protein